MIKILVDTDILIDYSKGFFKGLQGLKVRQDKGEAILYLNPVVISEYLADKSLKNATKLKDALNFISIFKTILINKRMGIITGEIMRNNPNLNWKDAMIAACCLTEDCQLATRNRKHFSSVAGLKFA